MVPIKRKERKKSFPFPFPRTGELPSQVTEPEKKKITFHLIEAEPFFPPRKPVQMVHLEVVFFFFAASSEGPVEVGWARNVLQIKINRFFSGLFAQARGMIGLFSLRLLWKEERSSRASPVRITFLKWSRTDATWNYGSFGFMLTRISGGDFGEQKELVLILN